MKKDAIYGISFDVTDPSLSCRREYDAVGMQNDYLVGDAFVNGGRNDFDDAFPFGAIRLCCVKSENGVRRVIYEGEEGFSRTGENGSVMVEIPKFYSRRTFEGDREYWAVSGVRHEGFSVDEAFLNGTGEAGKIYLGAYKANYEGEPSRSGVFPTTALAPRENLARSRACGYESLSFGAMAMLQKLIAIEFACLQMNTVFNANGIMPYNTKGSLALTIQKAEKNTVGLSLKDNKQRHKLELLHEGQQIGIGRETNFFTRAVTVTRREIRDDFLTLAYDGPDLTDQIRVDYDHVYGLPQKTGKSDGLSYHTGRTDFVPGSPWSHMANSFRWRGLEDVWGNVWEWVYGLKVHRLEYYYSFDPARFDQDGLEGFEKAPFPAPEQPYLGMSGKIWIVRQSRDERAPRLMLPTLCGAENGGGYGKFFSASFFSFRDHNYEDKPVDPNTVFWTSYGSGWDHQIWGSLFSVRCFMSPGSKNSLYGGRVLLYD